MTHLDHDAWNLRRWLLIASALIVILLLTACGGGDEADDIAGPPAPGAWNCWMTSPCDPATTPPTTRLIEPPRDSRVL